MKQHAEAGADAELRGEAPVGNPVGIALVGTFIFYVAGFFVCVSETKGLPGLRDFHPAPMAFLAVILFAWMIRTSRAFSQGPDLPEGQAFMAVATFMTSFLGFSIASLAVYLNLSG